jgi:hypothetical protein
VTRDRYGWWRPVSVRYKTRSQLLVVAWCRLGEAIRAGGGQVDGSAERAGEDAGEGRAGLARARRR